MILRINLAKYVFQGEVPKTSMSQIIINSISDVDDFRKHFTNGLFNAHTFKVTHQLIDTSDAIYFLWKTTLHTSYHLHYIYFEAPGRKGNYSIR